MNSFPRQALLWAACLIAACASPGDSAAAPASGTTPPQETLTRAQVLERLDERANGLLAEVESKTGLQVVFKPLPRASYVVAQFWFDPVNNTPIVSLRAGWQSHDVAHELTHMKLDLLDGFHVLAWRRGVERTKEVEAAFGRLRSYVDDQVVHARLVQMGYKLDGQVLSATLFDNMYTNVPRHLNAGRAPRDDGMAHLDGLGYGDLCRACFLVQAELVALHCADALPEGRLKLTRDFVAAFRAHRAKEAEKADKILALFKKYDVMTIAGHESILREWSQMEGLDKYTGISAYKKENGKYILPWP